MLSTGAAPVDLVDLRSGAGVPGQAARVVVVVSTVEIGSRGVDIGRCLSGDVRGALCVAVGSLPGQALSRPAVLLDPRFGLIWADDRGGDDGAVGHLLDALRVGEVFDAVLKAVAELPDHVACAGVLVGSDRLPAGELAAATDAALVASRRPAVARAAEPLVAEFAAEASPYVALVPEPGSPLAEAALVVHRSLSEAEAQARRVGRWTGVVGRARGHRTLATALREADIAVGRHRDAAARLLTAVDAHLGRDAPAAEARAAGAPPPPAEAAFDPAARLRAFTEDALRDGAAAATVVRLRRMARELDPEGCPAAVAELAHGAPPPFPAVAPLAPVAAISAAVSSFGLSAVAGWVPAAAVAAALFGITWLLTARWPAQRGEVGPLAALWRAVALVVPAAALGGAAGHAVPPLVALSGFGLGAALVVVGLVDVAALAWSWRRAAGRLRDRLGIAVRRERFEAVDRKVRTVLTERWGPADRRRRIAAALRAAADAVETGCAALPTPGRAPLPVRPVVADVLRGDLGAVLVSAVEGTWSGGDPVAVRSRAARFFAEHLARLADVGLWAGSPRGAPPAFRDDRDRLLAGLPRPARDALRLSDTELARRAAPLCPEPRSELLTDRVEVVRFAPAGVAAAAGPDVVDTADAALAGALVLTAVCDTVVHTTPEPQQW